MPAAQAAQARAQALAARAAGDRDGALALFREASSTGDPWSRNDAALELLALGRLDEAARDADALAGEMPNFAAVHRTLGLLARASGRRDAALVHFERAAACDANNLWNRHDAAIELRALGRFAEAEHALRSLAAATPLPHAVRGLGEAARERGDGEAALASFRVAAELLPDDPWFALDVAEAFAALGRLEEATASLAETAARHPRFAEVRRRLARLARRRGDTEAELDHWREVAALDPGGGELDLADALLERGDAAAAETIAARLLARYGQQPRPLRLLGRIARRSGDAERAHAHSRAACRLVPADAAARAERAGDALALGRLDEARREAEAALATDPVCPPARRVLALSLRAAGDEAGALALARDGWANGAGPSRAGFELAADLRSSRAFAEAEAIYEALARRPDAAPEALVELSFLARRNEGVGAARRRLDEALRADPAHPRGLVCLGDLERETGDLDRAEALYARALAARPGFPWALVGLALVAEGRGLGEASDAHWRAAIAADPSETYPRIAFAARLRDRGDADGARALLAALPATSPRASEAAMAEALIRRAEGDFAGAAEAFADVLRRWPDHMEARLEAAEEALRLGRAGDALRLLAEAEARHPEHPALMEALARHALGRDDLEAAADLFARAARADPTRLWPRVAGARILASSGRWAESEAAFDEIVRRFGERAEIAIARADLERQLGRPDEAEARLEAALARFPVHSTLACQAALAALEAGRSERAEAFLARAPGATLAERGRLHFVRCQLAAGRWDFAAAIAEGEAAARLLPADGWVRNRLAHAALLALDLDRAARVLADAAALEAGANALRGKSANPSQSHYGQLLDEFRLDGEALGALREALRLPPPDRLAALSQAALRFPDATAAAILAFIEARRSGALAPRLGPADDRIPRTIHQFWTDEDVPTDVAAHMATWREANPSCAHRVWSDESARAFLAAKADPAVRAAYERAREPAMKADLFRLALLHVEGGIWADADDRCLSDIEPLLARGAGLVTYQEDLGSLGNNWLAARPGQPILARALAEAAAAVNRGDNDILWLATGPGLLTRVAARALWARGGEGDDLLVLDPPDFLAHVAIHCLAAYKASERHWSRTAFGRARGAKAGAAQATRAASSSS